MKKTILLLMSIFGVMIVQAASNNTVNVVYDGTTATVEIADNISSYITVSSGTSSHVVITSTIDSEEITYTLSGSSDNGSFCMNGNYKCVLELNGLTLTNPAGPALDIENGKRIDVSAKKSTTNTLTDGKDNEFNGCIYCTGHLEFKGKGVLNVAGIAKHAIYSKEYTEVKNLTLNITSAKKDGIHCKQYFLMESGSVTISNTGDDAIQCELEGETSTGEITPDHEDEDSGNFYQLDGTLMVENCGGQAVHADGEIYLRGGTQNFEISTAINSLTTNPNPTDGGRWFTVDGRCVQNPTHGIYIYNGRKVVK